MELFTVISIIAIGFAILGLAAAVYGVDSRPTMQDDWQHDWRRA